MGFGTPPRSSQMRKQRTLPIILAVVVIASAVALLVFLRKHAPPEPARLLPGADGFLYINLQWMRRANITGELPPVPHDPDYERFIQATGFQFERDLDEAAVAVHYAPTDSKSAVESRFSEVFTGKIQGERLRGYLQKLSPAIENYRSIEIYSIPLEGRTLRVAILGVDTVAASNNDDPQVIRGIIDRSRKLASPFAGPALLRRYYKEIPLASLGWGIFKIQPSAGIPLPTAADWSFLFSKPAVVVASIRYLRALHFRAEAFTGSDTESKQLTDKLATFLNLFRAAETSVSTPAVDPDVNAFLDSLKVEPNKQRAVLTATVPIGLIRKVLAEAPTAVSPGEQQPAPQRPITVPKGRSTTKGHQQ